MKKLLFLSLLLVASPTFGQRRIDFLFDLEGVHRSGKTRSFSPGSVRFEPSFNNGGGIGAGLNFYLSDRVSLEAKVAGIESAMHVRIIGQDSVQNIDLGHGQIYPISAILQWHPVEHGTFRPYIGAGAVHTILRNINRQIPGSSATGIRFHDPTGVAVDGGVELSLGSKWSLYGDARYVPLESKGRATFVGANSVTELSVRPLIVSTGVAYHF